MTLQCTCGSYDLRITAQSYGEQSAFESYECGACGRTGTLTNDNVTGTTLSGCIGGDDR
jgi:hypothetical protein